MWQKPGTMQTTSSPTHKIPAHPGADDDTDDEEEELNQEPKQKRQKVEAEGESKEDDDADDEGEENNQDSKRKVGTEESKEQAAENKQYEPIKNLVENPPSEAEDDEAK